jgi:hypothetical protein
MSYQVGSVCYSTALQAAQAQASSMGGTIVQHSGQSYAVYVSDVTENVITYYLTPPMGGSVLNFPVSYSAQPCNLLTAVDGLTLGWLIIAVWAATYGVMFISRVFKGETGGDYGNS